MAKSPRLAPSHGCPRFHCIGGHGIHGVGRVWLLCICAPGDPPSATGASHPSRTGSAEDLRSGHAVLMTLSVALAIVYEVKRNGIPGTARIVPWASAGSFSLSQSPRSFSMSQSTSPQDVGTPTILLRIGKRRETVGSSTAERSLWP